jgi:hypothetical protein
MPPFLTLPKPYHEVSALWNSATRARARWLQPDGAMEPALVGAAIGGIEF